MQLIRPIQTRFRCGSPCNGLTLLHTLTRWLIMQKVRDQAFSIRSIALSLLVSTGFQILFHSPSRGSFHLSLTVLCAIGDMRVFSLGGWCPRIPTRRLRPRGTQDTARYNNDFVYGIITLYDGTFQNLPLSLLSPRCSPTTPYLP